MSVEMERRLRDVELAHARLAENLKATDADVSELMPIALSQARMGETMKSLDAKVDVLGNELESIRKALTDRDKQVTDERKSMRLALLTLTGVIGAALISAVGGVIVAVVGG